MRRHSPLSRSGIPSHQESQRSLRLGPGGARNSYVPCPGFCCHSFSIHSLWKFCIASLSWFGRSPLLLGCSLAAVRGAPQARNDRLRDVVTAFYSHVARLVSQGKRGSFKAIPKQGWGVPAGICWVAHSGGRRSYAPSMRCSAPRCQWMFTCSNLRCTRYPGHESCAT